MDPFLLGQMFGRFAMVLAVVVFIIGLIVRAIRNRSVCDRHDVKPWPIWPVPVIAVATILCISIGSGFLAPVIVHGTAWITFTSPDGRFTVSLPGKPKEHAETQSLPTGKMNMRMYTIDGDWMHVSYLVQCMEFPTDIEKESPRQILGLVRDMMAQQYGTTVKMKRDIKFGSHPGIEYTSPTKNGIGVTKVRMYVVGNYLYVLWANPISEKGTDENDMHFFDSFKLTKEPSATMRISNESEQ